MMPSFVGTSLHGLPSVPVQYTQDCLFDDISNHMSTATTRRQSRGANGALAGNAMRVVKPSSASNSPRNNMMLQRRRTLMNDPVFIQRAQQMLEQPYLPTPGPETHNEYYEPAKRTTRPISWHPSTQLVHPQQFTTATQPPQYSYPSYNSLDLYQTPAQFPPTPAAYSTYSSPASASALSPLTLPYSSTYDLAQNFTSPGWDVSAATAIPGVSSAMDPLQSTVYNTAASYVPAEASSYVEPSYSPASWTTFPTAGYNHSVTTPPTPEDPPKVQQLEPVVKEEERISYVAPESQHEDEDEGDILVGLGLYDPPEKLPSGLLGASFEPTGKGLKLEDAWEPPAVDDEEEDGEGEAEDEDVE